MDSLSARFVSQRSAVDSATALEKQYDLTIFGPWLIGMTLAGVSLGFCLHECGTYFLRSRDGWILKITVLLLLLGSLLDWVVAISIVWWFLITQRNISILDLLPPYWYVIEMAVPPISGLWAQSFFALRAWKIYEKSIWVGLLLGFLIFSSTFIGLFYVAWLEIEAWELTEPRILDITNILNQLPLWLGAVTDTTITFLLAIKLTKAKKGFNATTDSMLSRIIHMAVTTASLTVFCSVFSAIFLAALGKSQTNLVYYVFMLQLPNAYTYSVTYTLNRREDLGKHANSYSDPSGLSGNNTSNSRKPQFVHPTFNSSHQVSGIRVQVSTSRNEDTFTQYDHNDSLEKQIEKTEVDLDRVDF